MDAQEALGLFLDKALVCKKSRYIGFIKKTATRQKFLNTIYHELERSLDHTKRVSSIPKDILSKPAFIFEPPDIFGKKVSSLEEAYDNFMDSFLVISEDGSFGIHGPETFMDSRAFYSVL